MLAAAYLLILAAGCLVWSPPAMPNAPAATGLFWIYLLLSLCAEIYLIHFRRRLSQIYWHVKIGQVIALLWIIFMLVNGDFGTAILIELVFIGAELAIQAICHSGLNPESTGSTDTPPLLLQGGTKGGYPKTVPSLELFRSWFDREIWRFMIIALAVMIYTGGLQIAGTARFMLLMILTYRLSLSIYRYQHREKLGSPVDQRSAILQASFILLVGLMFIASPASDFVIPAKAGIQESSDTPPMLLQGGTKGGLPQTLSPPVSGGDKGGATS